MDNTPLIEDPPPAMSFDDRQDPHLQPSTPSPFLDAADSYSPSGPSSSFFARSQPSLSQHSQQQQQPPPPTCASPTSARKGSAETSSVFLSFLLFVVLRAMDRVFNKRVQDRMANYQLMYMNVLWPVGVQAMTIVISLIFVSQRRRRGDYRYEYKTFFSPNVPSSLYEGPAVPQYRLALFSFWDQVRYHKTLSIVNRQSSITLTLPPPPSDRSTPSSPRCPALISP